VIILEGQEDEAEKALREYREKMAALIPVDIGSTNFTSVFGAQKELDADFDAFMEDEYD